MINNFKGNKVYNMNATLNFLKFPKFIALEIAFGNE